MKIKYLSSALFRIVSTPLNIPLIWTSEYKEQEQHTIVIVFWYMKRILDFPHFWILHGCKCKAKVHWLSTIVLCNLYHTHNAITLAYNTKSAYMASVARACYDQRIHVYWISERRIAYTYPHRSVWLYRTNTMYKKRRNWNCFCLYACRAHGNSKASTCYELHAYLKMFLFSIQAPNWNPIWTFFSVNLKQVFFSSSAISRSGSLMYEVCST